MANRQKTVYVCSECGSETPNWAGKCPSCGAWNTLAELRLDKAGGRARDPGRTAKAKKLEDLDSTEEIRFSTGISSVRSIRRADALQSQPPESSIFCLISRALQSWWNAALSQTR